jgi:hypothetical protein
MSLYKHGNYPSFYRELTQWIPILKSFAKPGTQYSQNETQREGEREQVPPHLNK